MTDLDATIHEPVRLRIMMLLSGVDSVNFNFFLNTLGLTRGNLSSHMARIEQAGYIEIRKSFRGKVPHTDYCITPKGRDAIARYWQKMDGLRKTGRIT